MRGTGRANLAAERLRAADNEFKDELALWSGSACLCAVGMVGDHELSASRLPCRGRLTWFLPRIPETGYGGVVELPECLGPQLASAAAVIS